MGHLANLILALLAVGLADELGPLGPVRPELVPIALFAPYLAVPWIRRLVRNAAYGAANRWTNRLRRAPILAQLVADLGFGWGAWIEATRGPSDLPPVWPTAWELLRFAPFVIATLTTLDATARVHIDHLAGRRWLRFQSRTFFGAALPILVFLLVDSAIALRPSWAWSIHGVEAYSTVHSALLFGVLAISFPALLQHAWGAERLPEGGERRLVELVAERASFRCREVLLWRTGRSMANAMIVGVLPSTRRVFFSDSLLEALPPRELAAVTAHEVGHAKRGHIAIFLGLALAAFGALSLLASAWDPAWPVPFELGVLVVLGAGALAFGWLSRRFELEADLFATKLTGDPTAIGDALLRLGGRLRDVAGWRHFAPSARDAFLRRAAEDPAFLRAFERRMRLVRVVVLAAFVLGFGGSLVGKFENYDRERYAVALWQGDFPTAQQRAGALNLSSHEFAFLERAATELGDGADLPRLERAARVREHATARADLLHRADDPQWAEAIWLLDIAAAMGDVDAEAIFRAALRVDAGEHDALAELPEPWRLGVAALADFGR